MNLRTILSPLLLLFSVAVCSAYYSSSYPYARVAQRYENEPSTTTVYQYPSAPYKFSYDTGSRESDSDVARHFREESRDENGYVVGKYGYVDPYGKLRIVNYRAGPEGYIASGDIGPDEEALRQQRELYATDTSYQLQQQAWKRYANGQEAADSYGAQHEQQQSSSSSSSGSAHLGGTEWTSVSGVDQIGSSADYTTKGHIKSGQNRFAQRYTAAGGVISPASRLRESDDETKTIYHTIKSSQSSDSSYQNAAAASSAAAASASAASTATAYAPAPAPPAPVPAPAPAPVAYTSKTSTTYATKTLPLRTVPVQKYSYSYQIPAQTTIHVAKPARIVYQTKKQTFTSPSARLVATNQNSLSSSSASASAAASASSSSSGGAYTGAYGVKGGSASAYRLAPIRTAPVVQYRKVARYATGGPGYAVVNFQQGGPIPYKYSYSF